jgi:hypothetical protein
LHQADHGGDRPNASAEISGIAIRDCTTTIWLKKAIDADATAGP